MNHFLKQPGNSVKAELALHGIKMCTIAESLNVSKSVVTNVVQGRCTSQKIADEIARVLNKKPGDLWPGIYS